LATGDSKKQLGKIMLQQKLVSQDVLQEILDEQKREPGSRLASTAARKGRITMLDALRALAEQHGVPAVDLTGQVVQLATLRLIPEEIARERSVFPFRTDGEQLLLAMSSPSENEVVEEIEFITSKKVVAHVALDHVLARTLEHAYAALSSGEEYFVGAHVSDAQLTELGLSGVTRAPEPLSEPPPAPSAEVMLAPAAIGEALDEAFSQPVRTSEPPQETPDTSARVLLAHHDSEVRDLLKRALADGGVAVTETDDGVKALELVRAREPGLLVIDVLLPSVSGLDICRRLRSTPRYAALPIVVAGTSPGNWRLAEDLREVFGIEHVFERPIDAIRFARTVRSLLEGKVPPTEPPPLSPEAHVKWRAGMEAFEHGDIDTAITELEAGVQIDQGAFELYYHLGLLYGRREHLFAAVRALELAVALQPKHFSAVKNLAVVYQRVGFRRQAVDTWERAMLVAPDDEARAHIKQHVATLL
jgi:CheY-like chemotaxis protein